MITCTVTTVLFDIPGLTAAADTVGPCGLSAILDEYHAVVERIVTGHGGLVERVVGDDVAAVFGLLVAREDDPEQAVRAALRAVAELKKHARPDGAPLLARVGIETGEALVRAVDVADPGHGVLAGGEIGMAARVLAAAPPGHVAVGALTKRLTAGAFDYEAAPVRSIRRDSDRAAAWLVKTQTARPQARWTAASPAVIHADDASRRNLTQSG
jgi:class 3 adenylate cyclase